MAERDVILIVDDAPDNLHVLSAYLDELGFEVQLAHSGAKALRIAHEEPPDLVLMDVKMPEMNGFEACAQLKEDPRTSRVPVIFLSGQSSADDTIQGFDAGGVDFLHKPVRMKELFVRLRTHLELKKHRDRLEERATVDPVTGIANRASFDGYLADCWRRASRSGSALAAIMIDIDHFKAYNDRYGHVLGDVCLRRVAQLLAENVRRARSLLARYGGEEFVCLLPDVTREGAIQVAERLLEAVRSERIEHLGSPLGATLSISLGVSVAWPSRDADAASLVEAADKQLYRAKQSGRDKLAF